MRTELTCSITILVTSDVEIGPDGNGSIGLRDMRYSVQGVMKKSGDGSEQSESFRQACGDQLLHLAVKALKDKLDGKHDAEVPSYSQPEGLA